jgi:hypothetical protein
MKKIYFIPQTELAQEVIDPPKPAKNFIPEWYKKLPRKINKNLLWRNPNGSSNRSMKACVPVMDTLTSGYIITTSADIYVNQNIEYEHKFMWEVSRTLITTHIKEQYGEMPVPDGYEKDPFKWETDWIIKTPKGFSLLFSHPSYRFDLPFITFTGIVDADKYNMALNLPFFLKEGFEGLIPKGTPIAQVMPIKRESWKSSIKKYSPKQKYNLEKIKSIIDRSYKKTFWQKKEYL